MPTHAAIATIKNRLGLHARPAMAFVDLACTFASEITVRRTDNNPGDPVDGKSIMMMMMLAATQGTELEVSAAGDDAEKASAALKALIDAGFDEE
ncbi:MAG: HPr family phosphocarrier protein [Phycisphaerales bacterium]